MRRTALHPVVPDRVMENATFTIDDVLDMIDMDNNDDDGDLVEGLISNLTTTELEEIVRVHIPTPLPSLPPPPRRRLKIKSSKATINKKHSRAYKNVRQMR